MSQLVLRVRRGGKLIGSWTLGDEPIEMALFDEETGAELGVFTARGAALAPRRAEPAPGLDELPILRPERIQGDDFTVPFPEPTDLGRRGGATQEAARPSSRPRPIPNLARASSRQAGDDLTMPVPEHTGTLPLITGDLDEDEEDEGYGELGEVTLSEALEGTGELLGRATTAEEPQPDSREITAPEPSDPAPMRIQPAEVWVRKDAAWRAAGHLVPGQRVRMLGGSIKLDPDGRLVVATGERLAGTGTLMDGRHVEIGRGQEPLALPPGSSVLLCFLEHGLYVRAEPVAEAWSYGLPAAARL